MTFLNPFFLFGLAAASLPVLFHLFARRRSRRVEFSSLRFLQKLEKTSMRAVKIRQLLLLIIRTLLVAAIALAFARPALKGYLGSFFGSSHANTSMVFLIDNSASMSRSDERGELLKQAKESASAIAAMLEDGDDATLIPLASIERGAAYNPMHTKSNVENAINDVKIADRPASLGDGLRMASSVLSNSHNVNKEVYLFSDDQLTNIRDVDVSSLQQSQSGMSARDSGKVAKLFDASTRIYTMTLGNGDHLAGRNLAIDSLKPVTTIFEPGRPIQFEAWVRNTTPEAVQNIMLSLFYNGERVAQQSIADIAGNESQHVVLDGPARGSGVLKVRAELEPDALPFDNTRFAVITVPLSRHIGIFMQNPSESDFIELALEQTLTQSQSSLPFVTEVKPFEELRSLSSSPGKYDAVFVGLGTGALDESDLTDLKSYIASGHGAAVFLMPGIDIPSVNRDLSALGLPVIKEKEGTPNETANYLSFAQLEFSHPFFSGMFESPPANGTALNGIESPKIYESYDLSPNSGLPLIKLSNGSPFLVESKIGGGDVLLYSAPPTLDFSDWPKKSIFLPLIRRTASYASSIHSMLDENQSSEFVTTEPFDIQLPELAGEQAGATVLVQAPDGSSSRAQVNLSPAAKAQLHLDFARVAGNYSVFRDAEARDPIAAFAVNVQSDESDLRAATRKQMNEFLSSRMTGNKPTIVLLQPEDKHLAKAVEQSRYGVELWQSFLWLALILALIELLIAREARASTGAVKAVAAAGIIIAYVANFHTASASHLHYKSEKIHLVDSAVTRISILPSTTDADIKTFDNPHWIYVNRQIVVDHKSDLPPDRHQLYLFIPGTHPKDAPRGKGPYAFFELAANLGYHVIMLSYPDESAAAVCRNDSDPNAFEKFRMAIIQGGNSDHIDIAQPESIENRLTKLLQYLMKIRPRENWGQFLNTDGSVKWESIAVGGHSQGGGHAVLIATKHKVARVVSTGAPKDYNHNLDKPAAFYSEESATPKDRFFAFNHTQDEVGGTTPEQLSKNLKALGLDAFGAPADVDVDAFPYHHARILTTSFPAVTVTGPQSDGSKIAHASPMTPKNADRWKQVWTYLLTEPAP